MKPKLPQCFHGLITSSAALAVLAAYFMLCVSRIHAQSAVSVTEALDDPTGVWTGEIAATATSKGWLGVADPLKAHDGVDALRPVPLSVWWVPPPRGWIILPPAALRISRALPASSTVTFWWRRDAYSYSYNPTECRIGGNLVATVPSTTWSKFSITVSDATTLEFADYPQNVPVWIDELSSAPTDDISVIVEAPELTMIATSQGDAWEVDPDKAPGATNAGCLKLPAGTYGELRISVPAIGTLKYWMRADGAWTQTSVSVLAPQMVHIGGAGIRVDSVSWTPASLVPLEQALDTTLSFTSYGWSGVEDALMSPDGLDVAVATLNSAYMRTTISGPARVRYRSTGCACSVENRVAVEASFSGVDWREIIVREAGPQTLTWVGYSEAKVDSLTVEALPETAAVTLIEALDATDFTFSQASPTGWQGLVEATALVGQDAVYAPLVAMSGTDYPQSWGDALTAQFTVAHSAQVSFSTKFDVAYSGNYFVDLDGYVFMLSAGSEDWSSHEYLVGPGLHTIKWLAVANSANTSQVTYRRLMLDGLKLTSVPGIGPAEALELTAADKFLPVDPGSSLEIDAVTTHDGVDAMKLTLPDHVLRFYLAWDQSVPYYGFSIWVRTDAAAGTVRVNDIPIESGAWIPLVINIELKIEGPEGAHVWVDQMLRTTSLSIYGADLPMVLDTATAGAGEGYLQSYAGQAAHDGMDALAGIQSSSDDRAILEITNQVTGPATASFWWRAQRTEPSYITDQSIGSTRVTVDGTLAAVLDVQYAGPWRQASVQVPAGDHEVRISQNEAYYTTLFLDEFSTGPAQPLATYDGWMSARGLTGNAAAPASDADGDGWSNLAEFALNADPSSPASLPAPLSLTPEPWPGYSYLDSYRVHLSGIRPEALRYATITLESSSDLSADSWTEMSPLTPKDFRTSLDGTFAVSAYLTPSDRKFVRARFDFVP